MTVFRHAHAVHTDWRIVTSLALAQLASRPGGAQQDVRHALGLVYLTPPLAAHAQEIVDLLRERTGVAHWAGTVGHTLVDTPEQDDTACALSVMVCDLPPEGFRVFSGRSPAPRPGALTSTGVAAAHSALIHVDPTAPDVVALVQDMAIKVSSGQTFGGIASGLPGSTPLIADDVVQGGLAGVVFSADVDLRSRVTQGCTPLASEHVVSSCSANLIRSLDGRPALDVLLDDLGVDEALRDSHDGEALIRALPPSHLRSGLFVGLTQGDAYTGPTRPGRFDYLVRNLVGVDPRNRLVAIAARPQEGDRVVFCTRSTQTAHLDLIRACTELREDIETDGLEIRGGVYISCIARGRSLFGSARAEVDLVRSQLGEFPLVGFFANGEIAGSQVYGHTGVLTLFTAPRAAD